MPAFLTHKIAADNIRSAVSDPAVRTLLTEQNAAYQSGAQGGDYFYSYKYYSMWAGHRYKMFGWALHRARVKRFFLDGAQWIKTHPNDIVKAYFLGYVTHYALDMYVHPLVIRLGPQAMTSHNVVECAVDCMYAVRNGVDPWKFDKAQFIHDTYVPSDEIDIFLAAMMDKLYYGFTLPPAPYHTTYAYFEKFHRMLQQDDQKHQISRRFKDLFTILKTRTLVYQPYETLKNQYDYDAFYRRIDDAGSHAGRMIDAVTKFWDGTGDPSVMDSVFYNVNMNGVPITPIEERRVFRKLYKTAPLKG